MAATMAASARFASALALAFSLASLGGGCATQSTTLNQDTYEARKKLTRELIARADWASAFGYADSLHRERPRDPETLVLRGTIYRERGLWAESEADLLAALALDGRSPEAHAALGILYDVTMRPQAAEPQHREAVKLAPDSVTYLNNLGFSMFLRGKTKDAITYYQKAASLAPTSQRVRTNLGFAFAASGDLRRAAHEFDMGGTPAESKNNLGFAYERRGDFGHAYDLYLEATTLDPKSTHARSNLVHAAHELGREIPAVAMTPAVETVGPSAVLGPVVGPVLPQPTVIQPPTVIEPPTVVPPARSPSILNPSPPAQDKSP